MADQQPPSSQNPQPRPSPSQMQNPQPSYQLYNLQQPIQQSFIPVDPYINQPAANFLSFEAVRDALSIVRFFEDAVFDFRRKYTNNMDPLSEKSSELKLGQVLKDVLEAVQLQRGIISSVGVRLRSPFMIRRVLDKIGIPKCHQSFVEKFLLMPDLSYYSFIILMALFFSPAPYTA